MNSKLTIKGRLPSLNEVIATARGNKFAAARQKKDLTRLIAMNAQVQRVPHYTGPVEIIFAWIEKDYRRDIDNVAGGGTKFVLDGLVQAGVLPDDSRVWVRKLSHLFPMPDPDNPRIEIAIVEVKE